jgi:hypothetical protein
VSDIDTEVVDGLKALDTKRPIREADIQLTSNYDAQGHNATLTRFPLERAGVG